MTTVILPSVGSPEVPVSTEAFRLRPHMFPTAVVEDSLQSSPCLIRVQEYLNVHNRNCQYAIAQESGVTPVSTVNSLERISEDWVSNLNDEQRADVLENGIAAITDSICMFCRKRAQLTIASTEK